MFDGGEPDERYPLPDFVRDYSLAKRFGFTYQEILDSPAVWLDWLLSIDGVAEEARAKRNSVGDQGSRRN